MGCLRPDHTRKCPQARVVGAHSFVVVPPCDSDPIFGPLKLVLEIEEILVRLQVRIGFHGHEKPRQGTGQLSLSGLELFERRRVTEGVRRDLNGCRSGSCLNDLCQRRAFRNGRALDGGHEIGDQVGAPLILALDICPGGFGSLLLCGDGVVTTARDHGHHDDDSGDAAVTGVETDHGSLQSETPNLAQLKDYRSSRLTRPAFPVRRLSTDRLLYRCWPADRRSSSVLHRLEPA